MMRYRAELFKGYLEVFGEFCFRVVVVNNPYPQLITPLLSKFIFLANLLTRILWVRTYSVQLSRD